MEEVMLKTHLIITDIHNEYHIKWCGKIKDTKPKFKNGKPIFMVVSSGGRMEVNSTNMEEVEKCAKLLTRPKGRAAVTTDTARIYIVEENDNEKLLGVLTHDYVKTYAPMYDAVYYK